MRRPAAITRFLSTVGPTVGIVWALATVAGAPVQATCQPIDGLTPLLAPGSLLILGEIHGTVESPAFAAEVVCHVAAAGHSLVLALELLPAEAARIEPFLASSGSESDRSALLSGGRWRAAYQDGRSSQAMVDLLERARSLRADGGAIEVILFDRQPADGQSFDRDREMAIALGEGLAASEAEVALVLTGNVHSRVTVGTPWDPKLEPMAYHLARDDRALALGDGARRLVSLDVASRGGDAWMCRGASPTSCGVRRLGGRSNQEPWMIERHEAVESGHHGRYHVGISSASLPAVRGSVVRMPGPG